MLCPCPEIEILSVLVKIFGKTEIELFPGNSFLILIQLIPPHDYPVHKGKSVSSVKYSGPFIVPKNVPWGKFMRRSCFARRTNDQIMTRERDLTDAFGSALLKRSN